MRDASRATVAAARSAGATASRGKLFHLSPTPSPACLPACRLAWLFFLPPSGLPLLSLPRLRAHISQRVIVLLIYDPTLLQVSQSRGEHYSHASWLLLSKV